MAQYLTLETVDGNGNRGLAFPIRTSNHMRSKTIPKAVCTHLFDNVVIELLLTALGCFPMYHSKYL